MSKMKVPFIREVADLEIKTDVFLYKRGGSALGSNRYALSASGCHVPYDLAIIHSHPTLTSDIISDTSSTFPIIDLSSQQSIFHTPITTQLFLCHVTILTPPTPIPTSYWFHSFQLCTHFSLTPCAFH